MILLKRLNSERWLQTTYRKTVMIQKTSLMLLTLILLLGSLTLSGCNTVEGLGKDIQRGGEKIERAGSS
jgi:predicted small secreted protein